MANKKDKEKPSKGQKIQIGKMSDLIENAIGEDDELKKLAEKAAKIKKKREQEQ